VNPLTLRNYWRKKREEIIPEKKIGSSPSSQIRNLQNLYLEFLQINANISNSSPPPLQIKCVNIDNDKNSFNYQKVDILSIGVYVPFSCIVDNIYPVSKSHNGFISIIKLKCSMCGLINQIETDDTSENYSNLNAYMISEIISITRRHSQLKEFCAAINTYTMLLQFLRYGVQIEMSKTAKEETRIACLKGKVDHDSITSPLLQINHGPKNRIEISIIHYWTQPQSSIL
ncbi:hypothetical protein V1477_013263, partial [Vespula maculifrons]